MLVSFSFRFPGSDLPSRNVSKREDSFTWYPRVFFSFSWKGSNHSCSQLMERSSHSKYLGVDLTSDLGWKQHIERVSKKANSMLGFLKRNLKSASQSTKVTAYRTIVRPHLEYCSCVWNPYTQADKNTVEAVQRRAARYVFNRYEQRSSVTAMLEELEWESLESRRVKNQLCSSVQFSSRSEDDVIARGKAHMRSVPSLRSLLTVARDTVPMLVWLIVPLSLPFNSDFRPLPLLTPLSRRRSTVWCSSASVRVFMPRVKAVRNKPSTGFEPMTLGLQSARWLRYQLSYPGVRSTQQTAT